MAASLGEAVVEVGADTSRFKSEVQKGVNDAVSNASKSMQNLGSKMSSVGKKMTVGITAPLVGIGVAAAKTAGEFESTMNVLQANTGASGKEMSNLSALAKKLGADTVFSANEAADAMLELAKGGFSQAEIAGGTVQSVMALAATEGMELATTAEVIANNMNAFGISANNAAMIADTLAAGSAASTASVSSLAEGLSNVGGQARNFGLDLQDTVGVLAAFDQNAIRGAEGGTALNSLLTKLSAPTKKAAAAMKEYGIEITNQDGSFKSITKIAGEFSRGLGDLSDEERARAVTTIAGSYGQRALNVLMKEGESGMKKYAKETRQTGVAQKLADARMKGMAGAVEQMRGAMETAALTIGEALAPTIVKVADFIGMLAEKFTTLPTGVQRVVVVFAAVAAAMGPVLIIVGTLISSIGTIIGVFGGLSLAVAAPVAAVVLLVGALGVLLYKSEDARAAMVKAFEAIKAAVLPAVKEIAAIFTGTLIPAFIKIQPVLQKVGEALLTIFAGAVVGVIQGFVKMVVGAFNVIGGVVKVISGVLAGDWSKAWEGVKQIFTGALGALLGMVQAWFSPLLAVFRARFQRLMNFLTASWNVIKGIFSAALSGITTALSVVTQILTAPFRVAFSALLTLVHNSWVAVRAVFGTVLKSIRVVVGIYFRAYRAVIVRVMRGIQVAISTAMNAARKVVATVSGAILKVIRGSWNAVRGATTKAWGAIRSSVTKVVGGLSGIVSKGFSKVVTVVSTIPGRLRNLSSKFGAAGKAVIGAFINGLSRAGSFATDFASSIWNAVRTAINAGIDKLNNLLEFDFKVKGIGIHVNAPDIGHLAKGTDNWRGGLSIVGEKGPELVNLPKGSRVSTAKETQQMLGGRGLPSKMILRVGARDFVAYVEEIADDRIDAADSLAWQGA